MDSRRLRSALFLAVPFGLLTALQDPKPLPEVPPPSPPPRSEPPPAPEGPKPGEPPKEKEKKEAQEGGEKEEGIRLRDAGEAGDGPTPPGATLEDLRAMRGARAMLEAEARLQRLLKEGKIQGDVERIVTFEEISEWPYEDGLKGMPEEIRKLHGKRVLMTGFMLPIHEVENIREFLLVQSLWSCCFGQPPDINGIVKVEMKGERRVQYHYDPVMVTGTFLIKANYDDDFCLDIYTLEAESVKVIQ